MQKEIISTYERLIPSKVIPYWVYFPSLSFILLFIFEIVIGFDANQKSQISIIGIMTELAIMPTFFIWASKRFQIALREISPILWDEDSDFQQWLLLRTKRIFTLDSLGVKIVVALMAGGAIITLILSGLLHNKTLPDLFIIIVLSMLAFVGSQGAYMLIDTGVTLYEIVHRPVKKTPFFLYPPPAINSLQNFYLTTILIAVITYGIFVLAAWQYSSELKLSVITWIWIGGIFPLLYFLGSFFQFHILLKRIKIEQVKQINEKTQAIINNVEGQINKDQLDILERLMNIQSKVQNLRDLPFSLESSLTFLLTLVIPFAKFIIELFK